LDELIQTTTTPNLEMLTAGSLGPDELGGFSRSRFGSLLEICRSNYDVIVVDSPPVLGISDASVVCQEVDVTLLLIQHRRYPRNVSMRAKRVIDEVGGKLFGVILNNVNIKTDDNYYYYAGYSTQYGYKRRMPKGGKKAASGETKDTGKTATSSQPETAAEVGQPEYNPDSPLAHAPKVTYIKPPQDDDRF
jgi:Mrp family chromosome partitioning ATPase